MFIRLVSDIATCYKQYQLGKKFNLLIYLGMFRKDFLSMWSLSNTLNKWSNREGLTTKSSKGTVDLGFGKFENLKNLKIFTKIIAT